MDTMYKINPQIDELLIDILSSPMDITLPPIAELMSFKKLSHSEALNRNHTITQCPICCIEGNDPNMKRWHFENCKQSLLNCLVCGDIIPRQGTKPYQYNKKKYCNRKCYGISKVGVSPIKMTKDVRDKLSTKAKTRSLELSERIKMSKPWIKSGRWK